MAALLQSASNALQARLDLEILLEVRPTVFHVPGVRGWSLTLLAVAHGHDEADARRTWGIAMQAAREALMDRDAGER